MILTLSRRFLRYRCTIGDLALDDWSGFSMEPPAAGVTHEVLCVPAGQYVLKLNDEPSMLNSEFAYSFQEYHRGMIELQDVPGREHVQLIVGSFPKDAKDGILVGLNTVGDTIYESVKAYRFLYPLVSAAILAGDDVLLDIRES